MNSNNFIVMKFAQIELPSMKESKRNEWIDFGTNNDFPDHLQELMKRSALHNAILVSKTESIVGKGISYEKNVDKKTDAWLAKPNPYESADQLLRKITWDLELYGGYYLNTIWSRDRKTIAETYHIEFSKIRAGKPDQRGNINEFYYCEDWSKSKQKGYSPTRIQAFRSDGSGDGSQIMFIKPYVPGQAAYPLPSYVGALSYIEVDAEIANFHLAHIRNGMNPSVIITFTNGIPSEDERKALERQMNNKFSGTDNAGKFMMMFAEDGNRVPQITTFSPSQLDKQFIQLQNTVLQNILSGHRVVSPMLVGIKTEGQLGGASELMNSYQIYQKSVIDPHRQIIEDSLNTIGSINGLQPLNIQPNEPIEFQFSENIMSQIMTIDELRAKIGLDPLPVEEQTEEYPKPTEVVGFKSTKQE